MLFTTLALLFTTTLAVPTVHEIRATTGRAIVTNQCDSPIYLWSVGGSIGPAVTIGKDSSYSETFRRDPQSGGIALKMTPVQNGLFMPNVSQTIFSYNLDGNKIWYDLSDVFGDAFWGRRVTIRPSDTTCQEISWPWGKPPGGSQVKVCGSGSDLTLSFCTDRCLPAWRPLRKRGSR
ncbi:hypothetical protein M011DRAFT_471478 [Sporormia fimetaria CBS 119925]|uniref:BYS1 domain protein n=1 Tax=Sporormia fimetaria CBS 119925 TaxID=1340428 RepID=A0A6A6V005_9PLEO|nr:hypothetical protein M011DRAFT_471478 [Sporormia fimetaria CBS 119925]